MYREDLKECGFESSFKDKLDCDFFKNLEFWERFYVVREKEKKDVLEKERKEKGRVDKYKEKFSERERSDKFIFDKC